MYAMSYNNNFILIIAMFYYIAYVIRISLKRVE